MLANMASSLILNKKIKTTEAKAKALRTYVEPLITKSKEDSTHSRRVVFSYLKDKYAVSELFREVSPKVADRPGGYTRILKIGNRLGDAAEMCIIELVDFNENLLEAKETKTRSSRRRRGKKKSPEAAAQAEETVSTTETANEVKEEKPAAEEAVVKEEKPAGEKAEAEKEPEAETKKEDVKPEAETKKEDVKAEAKDKEPEAEVKGKAKEAPKAAPDNSQDKKEDKEEDKKE